MEKRSAPDMHALLLRYGFQPHIDLPNVEDNGGMYGVWLGDLGDDGSDLVGTGYTVRDALQETIDKLIQFGELSDLGLAAS